MHFRVPISTDSGNEIVNSRIRVFFPGNYEYFQADVIDYDPATNKHHLLYIIDREESDEDLSKEKWFILDTSKKSAKISKKRSDTPNTSPLPPPTPTPPTPGTATLGFPPLSPQPPHHPTRST